MKYIRPKTTDIPIRYIVTEDVLVDKWLALIRAEHAYNEKDIADKLEISEVAEHMLDPGGMVSVDEPEISIMLDGFKYSIYIRSLDSVIIQILRHVRTHSKPNILGKHVFVNGWLRGLLLTPQTASKLADLLEKEMEARKEEIEEAWNVYDKRIDNVNNAGDGELKVLPRNMNLN